MRGDGRTASITLRTTSTTPTPSISWSTLRMDRPTHHVLLRRADHRSLIATNEAVKAAVSQHWRTHHGHTGPDLDLPDRF